jgi:hypothetical protein
MDRRAYWSCRRDLDFTEARFFLKVKVRSVCGHYIVSPALICYVLQQKVDINKSLAMAAVQAVFGSLCHDGAAALINRIATLSAPTV